MKTIELILVCVSLTYSTATPKSSCQRPAVLELPGDAVLSGLFHIHNGPNCSQADAIGLQQMAASAWIINTLNKNKYLPGIKLGVALYDACSTTPDEVLISFTNEECKESYNLGLLTTPDLNESLELDSFNETLLFLTRETTPDNLLVDTTINILSQINWTIVDYIFAPTKDIQSLFSEKTAQNGICIIQQRLLPDFQNVHWKIILQQSIPVRRNTTLIIVFGTWKEIYLITKAITEKSILSVQWILVPINSTTQHSDIESAPINSLVILPGIGILQEKRSNNHMNLSHNQEEMYNMTVHKEKRIFISYPLFMDVAFPVFNILTRFMTALIEYCITKSEDDVCSSASTFHSTLNLNDSSDRTNRDAILHMILSSDYIVVTAASHIGDNNELEDFAVYEDNPENQDMSIKIVHDAFNDDLGREYCDYSQNNYSLQSICSLCSNFEYKPNMVEERIDSINSIYYTLTWRPDAWVAAVASIGAVGIICAFSIIIFILVRVCKKDVLEGNPVFSFLLLLSVIFTYLSTLPYSFNVDNETSSSDLFCILRITGTSLSYAFLFSIMLSRTLMLAAFDNDGTFMNHINGFLQTILCIFILGVQVALSVQFFIIRSFFFTADKCSTMFEGYNFQILLCYDIFLLLMLVCTSPFSVRSKRNYSEGMFFTLTSFICLLVWVCWTTAYLLLPREWKDVAISGGLTATATAILVTVFIPRTYLMMTGIVRDNLASALPSLACTNSTSILDLNYRTTSNQVLYDCVNPFPGGQLNPNFYSEQPQAISVVKPEDIDHSCIEDTYEMYDSPTSPNKVTHF